MEGACLGLIIGTLLVLWWVASLQGPSVSSEPHRQTPYRGDSAPLADSAHAARERDRGNPRARAQAANRRRTGLGPGVELRRIAPQPYEGRKVNACKVKVHPETGQVRVLGYQWIDWD